MPILQVDNLSVEFNTLEGIVKAVDDISFSINRGEVLGIVGESGCGKSQSMLAIMGLLAPNAKASGSVKFLQQELLGLNKKQLNKLRGNNIAFIFQDPLMALNPYLSIQSQMSEVLMLHKGMTKREAVIKSIEMLDLVKIPDAKSRVKLYPHEFSGGQCQRIMIAMALLCRPELLIADEPTTALDATVQLQILQLINEVKTEFNMAVIIITHDMGVVAHICDRVNVMYAGRLMEKGSVEDIFYNTSHPYTEALLTSVPDIRQKLVRLKTIAGEPPNLLHVVKGCAFKDRCPKVHEECKIGDIKVREINIQHTTKCNLY